MSEDDGSARKTIPADTPTRDHERTEQRKTGRPADRPVTSRSKQDKVGKGP